MRFFTAFVISLFVYSLLIWLYATKFSIIKLPPPKSEEHLIKIDIRNIVTEPIIPKMVKRPIEKKLPKKVIKKKVVKKKIVKKKIIKKKIPKKKVVVEPKVVEPRVEEFILFEESTVEFYTPTVEEIVEDEVVFEEVLPKEVEVIENEAVFEEALPHEVEEYSYEAPTTSVLESVEVEKNREVEMPLSEVLSRAEPSLQSPATSDALASFFSNPNSMQGGAVSTFPNPKIGKLYGARFHTFSESQKRFIENNLDKIQGITQEILVRRGYPDGARRTRQEGTNVVSFNLHPNGDISDLHLEKYIGSRSLDENTLSLIKTAYKDYPYPSSVTQIVFYVTYSIYGY